MDERGFQTVRLLLQELDKKSCTKRGGSCQKKKKGVKEPRERHIWSGGGGVGGGGVGGQLFVGGGFAWSVVWGLGEKRIIENKNTHVLQKNRWKNLSASWS